MMVECMVTYGRGLNDFVWKEILKKIPNVDNLRHLGEGKIAFTTSAKFGAYQSQGNGGKECDTGKDLLQENELIDNTVKQNDMMENKVAQEHTRDAFEKGHPGEILEINANSKEIMEPLAINTEESIQWVSAALHIFKLKLVERVFILLHCEDLDTGAAHQNSGRKFDVNNILRDYENKLKNLVINLKWNKLAERMRKLREHQDEKQRVLCQNPDSCPGSLRRKQERKRLEEKREASMSLTELQGIITKHHKTDTITREHSQIRESRKQKSKRRKLTDSWKVESLGDSNNLCNYENGKILESNVRTYNIGLKRECKVENVHDTKRQNLHCHYIDDKAEIASSQDAFLEKDSSEVPKSCLTSQNAQLISDCSPPFPQGHKPEEIEAENQDFKVNTSEHVSTFRVSSRVSGPYKNILTVKWINHTLSQQLNEANTTWTPDWRQPLIDLYVNITASHFIVGAALSLRPLSLRSYIPHLTLRSTISHLMATLSQMPPGATVLDPMCGGGSILLETAMNFDLSHVIASDSSREQLEVAQCNLHNLPVPVTLLEANAEKLPLQDCSIDTVLCDFPFGHKYKLTVEDKQLLAGVLMEVQRLLVCGGQAVFLLSPSQHQSISHPTSDNTNASTPTNSSAGDSLTLQESHLVSLGETSAYVAVLIKGSTSAKVLK